MSLYTFIMEYKGGTYICQVKSTDELKAMQKWILALNVEEINGFSKADKQRLIDNKLDGETPILIKGMKNVWHFLIEAQEGFGHINFVKTEI